MKVNGLDFFKACKDSQSQGFHVWNHFSKICDIQACPFWLVTIEMRLNIYRTESKGGGLQAISSKQFSVPALGSTNFLDPRKLLRTVLSGF